ncbi:hypothetical protein H1D32_09910 [Anaerobacillus sp. CMMVII]|uniref:hypothetical protein n=1 Tax=Anaerobacillus sp. CMMVII TaxID=2755588 RepID=UPI0021B7B8C6|nr:hypothetical protein [Anaerobacillus sp. CMMVII]MCT8138045.1 hypothetical protein [Anaerobacillus sp. CMMVII]
MDGIIKTLFANLQSEDKNLQYEAYQQILSATENKVDWAYDVWDHLKADLTNPDNHQRSRAAQFLASLAKSDPEKRMLKDFPELLEVTKDKKFVTARHSLQSIWKVGLAGAKQKEMLIQSLTDRFLHCLDEKNYTLVRFDIIQGLRNLFDQTKDETVKLVALDLIEKEEDPKYKKKYATVWKKVGG